jgi:hypothetical protein
VITIDPKALGEIDAFQEALKSIEKIGDVFKAVDLHAKERAEGTGSNNAQILDWLGKQGRDFVTPRDGDVQKIAQAFADSVIEDLGQKLKTIGSKTKTGGTITADQIARQISGKAYKKAAQVWLEEITRRIEDGDFDGGGDSKLSPEYEKYKEGKFGFAYPIGKASGQVLDNVSPKTRNLKLRK